MPSKVYIFKNNLAKKHIAVIDRTQAEAQVFANKKWRVENTKFVQAVELGEYLANERKYQK